MKRVRSETKQTRHTENESQRDTQRTSHRETRRERVTERPAKSNPPPQRLKERHRQASQAKGIHIANRGRTLGRREERIVVPLEDEVLDGPRHPVRRHRVGHPRRLLRHHVLEHVVGGHAHRNFVDCKGARVRHDLQTNHPRRRRWSVRPIPPPSVPAAKDTTTPSPPATGTINSMDGTVPYRDVRGEAKRVAGRQRRLREDTVVLHVSQ